MITELSSKIKKQFALLMMISFVFSVSCSDDNDEDKSDKPEGVFIEINNDIRKPSLVNETGYKIEISSSNIIDVDDWGAIKGVIGTVFDLNIVDDNRKYIGGIAGITSCAEIRVEVAVYDIDIEDNSSYKTVFFENANDSTYSKPDIDFNSVKNKCIVVIQLLDNKHKIILEGFSIENQTVLVKKELGEYVVEFSDIKFKAGKETFTASGRIITN